MSNDWALIVITIVSIIVLIGIAPFIKRVLNCYPIWCVVGILLLAYLITMRFGAAWVNVKNNESRAYLTDWCPFGALLTCVLMIVDPTRRVLRTIGTINVFAGLLTIFALPLTDSVWGGSLWNDIWRGNEPNPIYFSMHYIMLMGSLAAILSGPCLKFRHALYAFCGFGFYLIYVTICIKTLHLTNNVTGLVSGDWDFNGEYRPMFEVINQIFFHNRLQDDQWRKALVVTWVFVLLINITLLILFSLLMRVRFWKWYRVMDREHRFRLINMFGFWELNNEAKKLQWWLGWFGNNNKVTYLQEYKCWDDKFFALIRNKIKAIKMPT